MARGGKRGHKGGSRKFTNPEALKQQMEKEEKEREWRRQKGYESESSEEESGEEKEKSSEESDDGGIKFDRSGDGAKAGPSGKRGAKKQETSSEESSSEEESDDENKKRKGVEGLIEIENPNLKAVKQKKVAQIDSGAKGAKPQLSRREREEIEKQKAKAHYQKLHAAGKTDEAKADLARLAIIRKQREEAAKKREAEAQAKLDAAKAKREATDKALGKRGKK